MDVTKKGYDIVKEELTSTPSRRRRMQNAASASAYKERSSATSIVPVAVKQTRWGKKWEELKEKVDRSMLLALFVYMLFFCSFIFTHLSTLDVLKPGMVLYFLLSSRSQYCLHDCRLVDTLCLSVSVGSVSIQLLQRDKRCVCTLFFEDAIIL